MDFTLRNDKLTATFKAQGAELCTLTDTTGTEYIWNADPAYWGRHTPILFPFVGKVIDNEYTYLDTSYTIGQHGFARDQVFEVVEHTNSSLCFKLSSDASSKSFYPFDFNLFVIYTLLDDTLQIAYQVENTDSSTIGFKIGAHPGFNCPLNKDEFFEDYYFVFQKPEQANLMLLTKDGYFDGNSKPFTTQKLDITHELFKNDALVLSNLSSKWVELRSHKSQKGIRFGFEGFPFLGLWSPPQSTAPFVCIEPWFGHADFLTDSKQLMEKKDLITLSSGEVFKCMHTITVL